MKTSFFKKKSLTSTKISIILTFAALLLFAGIGTYFTFMSKAATNGFYLSPSSSTITAGATFNVQVGLNYGSPVDTVQTYISYPSNLEVVGAPTVGEPYESDFENNTATQGLIKIQRSDFSDAPPAGDRVISTITFKAKTAGSATVAFTSNTYGVNKGTQLAIPSNNAAYTISGPAAPPAPPAAAPPAPAPAAPTATSSPSAPAPSTPTKSTPSSPSRTPSTSRPPTGSTSTTPSASPSSPGPSSPTTSAPATEAPTSEVEGSNEVAYNQGKPNQTQPAIKKQNNAVSPFIMAGGIALILLTAVAAIILRRRVFNNNPFSSDKVLASPNSSPGGIYSDSNTEPVDNK